MTDRKSHWDHVYASTSPLKVSWYQNAPVLSLQLIHNTGLALDAPLIDVGGGASLLVDCLCKQGYSDISVLDISAKALEYTRNRLLDKGFEACLYEADVTRFEPPHMYSLWHDRAVFHFLTDSSDRTGYVNVMRRALAPGGHLIIAAFAIGGPTKCSGLDIVQYDADKLVAELGDGFDLVEETSEKHLTPAKMEQKFAYFRFLRRRENSQS